MSTLLPKLSKRTRAIVFILVFIYLFVLAPTLPIINPYKPILRSARINWKPCDNTKLTSLHKDSLDKIIHDRLQWGQERYYWKECQENPCQRDSFMVSSPLTGEKTIENAPLPFFHNIIAYYGIARPFPHSRFDMMGPIQPEVCHLIQIGETEDESRQICILDDDSSCSVFSIGSNNQWEFEQSIAGLSKKCEIHTFDCTVKEAIIPNDIEARVRFYNTCLSDKDELSNGLQYTTLSSMVNAAGGKTPTLLKMDIEGFEWIALLNIIESAKDHYQKTGEDILPAQIALEVHYTHISWSYGSLSARQLLAYFNRLFFEGGYVLAARRPRLNGCFFCEEILLVKAKC